jgi:hypothetical protein
MVTQLAADSRRKGIVSGPTLRERNYYEKLGTRNQLAIPYMFLRKFSSGWHLEPQNIEQGITNVEREQRI